LNVKIKPVNSHRDRPIAFQLEAIERPDGVFIKRARQLPSQIKVDGLWVHRGVPGPGANWDLAVEDVCDERIRSILKI
jgi:hypothetical protein